MPRGTSLVELVRMLRAEIGHSTSPAVGLEKADQLKQILRRTQIRLYDEHDWVFMRAKRDVPLSPGQRYYDFPADMDLERVNGSAKVRWGENYYRVEYGISEDDYDDQESEQSAATAHFDVTGGTVGGGNQVTSITIAGVNVVYTPVAFIGDAEQTATAIAAAITASTSHPEYTATADGNRVLVSANVADGSSANARAIVVTVGGDVTVSTPTAFAGGTSGLRIDPIEKWDIIDTGTGTPQIEVWPLPASNSMLRFRGVRALRPLIADGDVADLDDVLIVLWAAAELRAGKGDEKAKSALAQRRLNRLKGNGSKRASFRPGEAGEAAPARRQIVVRISGGA